MKTSESITSIAKALIEFHKQVEPIKKNATADTGKYSYSYATLENVIEKTKDALQASSLIIVQSQTETRLIHATGEWIEIEIKLPSVKEDPQKYGSAITYARRYGYAAILGLATETDDDASSATDTTPSAKQPTKPVNSSTACPICHAPAGKPHASTCSRR